MEVPRLERWFQLRRAVTFVALLCETQIGQQTV
jgi:hypothetical protein